MSSQADDGSRGARRARNSWGKSRIGIYAITHVATGRRYIGQSEQLERRWTFHRCNLRGGRHRNRHLQAAWDKYGEEAFTFEIVELVADRMALDEREQAWLDATPLRFNHRLVAESNRGWRMSEEQRARQLGRRHRPETIAKMQAWERTPEMRLKMSAGRKGQRWSDETYKRMGDARRGFRHSEDTKARMRLAKRPPPTIAAPEVLARVADGKAHNFLLVSPDRTFFVARNLRAACRLLALDQSAMLRVSGGTQGQHKGWVCFRITTPMPNGVVNWMLTSDKQVAVHLTPAHYIHHAALFMEFRRDIRLVLLTSTEETEVLRQANSRARRRPRRATNTCQLGLPL